MPTRGMGWSRSFHGWLYWTLLACLVVAATLLVVRRHRASVVAAPITAGLSAGFSIDDALEATRRVAERFRHIDEHGKVGEAASWPLKTDADYLLTGGGCGEAAGALGATFALSGRPFRVIQVNVGSAGAAHVMVEIPDNAGRWVLLDPLEGRAFPAPQDGRLLGLEEIRALPVDQRGWLAEEYRDGEYSLFAPYRRTNWAKLSVLAVVIAAVAGDHWMSEVSLRAMILRSDRPLIQGTMAAMLLLAIAGWLQAARARRPKTEEKAP